MSKKTVVVKHKSSFSNTITGQVLEIVAKSSARTVATAASMMAMNYLAEAIAEKRVKNDIDTFMNKAKEKAMSSMKK